jgi:AraC-like DNA-binding protein
VAYWEAPADDRLAPFVEAFCFSTDEAGRSPPVRVVPDGRVDLLVSVERDVAPERREVRAHVFGAKTRALVVESAGPVENVAVRFRPGAAFRLLATDAHELVDRAVELRELWGARGAELVSEIQAARSLQARRKLLEAALLERLPAAIWAVDLGDRISAAAVERIVETAGQLSIRRLAALLGVGERRLERLFRARLGITPKLLARIVRFRAAYEALARGDAQVEVALDRGYFDQPHLLRDFYELAGASPREVFAPVSDSSNRVKAIPA